MNSLWIFSASFSSLAFEVLVPFIAGIGGILVFLGLWMEGPPDDKGFPTIAAFRRHKVRAKQGWNILMVGIFVEIIVAIGIAAWDGWKARQTDIAIDEHTITIADMAFILSSVRITSASCFLFF